MNDTFNDTFTWDAYGNLSSVNGQSITYDAFGRMAANFAGTHQFVYSPTGGQPLAVMSGQSALDVYVPLPGGAFAMYNSSGLFQYNHADWRGSAPMLSTPTQGAIPGLSYAPFGEGYGGTGWAQFTSAGNPWTLNDGNNNDGSTLDDFLFRRYSAVQGRWISPDPAGLGAVDPTNPQSWNRYAYVNNNPSAFIDPTGLQSSGVANCNDPQIRALCQSGDSSPYNGLPSIFGGFSSWDGLNINWIWGTEDDLYGVVTLVPAANNGNFSWWGAFAKNLFSWKNFTDEFKQGGCVGVFVDAASEGGILPDLPAGHGVEDAVTDASKMAAATYAVNQGLVVPLRSSVVRGILDLGETSASGLVLADTYAKIGAGGLAEYNAIKNGDCH